MYLDPNDAQVIQLVNELYNSASDLVYLQTISHLKPVLSKDGNMYCYLLGELPNDCCVGFGETVFKAAKDFYHNLHNQKA